MKKVKKEPVINGQVNKYLSLDELLSLDEVSKKNIAWRLTLDCQSFDSGDVTRRVMTKTQIEFVQLVVGSEWGKPLTWEALENTELDVALKYAYDYKVRFYKECDLYLSDLERRQGRRIFREQKGLNYQADYQFSPEQLKGYVKAFGQRNGFVPAKIIAAIDKTEKILPRKNYGVNNPNTGTTNRFWHIKGDYIYVKSGNLNPEGIKDWLAIEEQMNKIWMKANADSFQLEKEYKEEDHGRQVEYVTYLMWWD